MEHTSLPATNIPPGDDQSGPATRKESNADEFTRSTTELASHEKHSLVHSSSTSSLPPSIAARVGSREPHWKSKESKDRTKKHVTIVAPTMDPSEAPSGAESSVATHLGLLTLSPGPSKAAPAVNNRGWHVSPEWLELTTKLHRYSRKVCAGEKDATAKTASSLDKITEELGLEYLVLAWKWASDDNRLLDAKLAYHEAREARQRDSSLANRMVLNEVKWHLREIFFNRHMSRSEEPGCAADVLAFAQRLAAQLSVGNDEMRVQQKRDLINSLLEAVGKRARLMSRSDFNTWGKDAIPWLQHQKWFGEPDEDVELRPEAEEEPEKRPQA